ncbi:MAG: tetratricopeptide repeat protein, partial [Verrucomicrobia bacterium]|nr:tetratricopeptide repeat protein [Verrucomicrobiota bacterium]
MRNSVLPLLALLTLFCAKSVAAPPPDFDAANRLFDKGDFQGARAKYETLVQAGTWSAHLFYNLGNAAFRLGDRPAAFLAYERALALEPNHPEAK